MLRIYAGVVVASQLGMVVEVLEAWHGIFLRGRNAGFTLLVNIWGCEQQEWGIAFANSVSSSDADEQCRFRPPEESGIWEGTLYDEKLVVSWKLPYAAALSL
ncbi:uncharacterized protein EAF01_001535 [Botrytis porri]|uniref:uncharacterized protein n=1 Tax=Botrytis porri TaxID=87229 RepID=UPI0018FF38AC|nr:uncharacterized protein EAF01_001535 [Botrytis porri]KAF7912514.1 hypothetical protein EAF01_001535 [Botrytis porri]